MGGTGHIWLGEQRMLLLHARLRCALWGLQAVKAELDAPDCDVAWIRSAVETALEAALALR